MLVTSRSLAPGDPSAIAVTWAGGEVTRGEFLATAAQATRRAASWPVREGDPVPFAGLVCDESPGFLALFLGLCRAGWAVGVIDAGWRHAEADAALGVLAPSVVLSPEGHSVAPAVASWDAAPAPEGWAAWAAPGADVAPPRRDPGPGDVFYVGFTSGTSGVPKAFMRSHRSWWESFERFSAASPLPEGRVVVPGGMSSSHFLFGALHALHEGAHVELRDGVEGGCHGAQAPAAMYVVPTMLAMAVRSGSLGGTPPRRLYCAGARLEAAVLAGVRSAFPGSTVVEYYGASELSFVTLRRDGDVTPPGSVGRPFPGVEVDVRGDDGVPVAEGETGTIHVRSPLVFAGYRGGAPPGATGPAEGGWLTVGDRGRVDADGYLWVDGRGSALIITGGANVQPEEVEEVVASAPGVDAAVVVGLPDPTWGQVVCAAIVPGGGPPRRADLRTHVASRLSPHKRPRRYVVLHDPVPIGRTGKVDRDAVRALVDAGRSEDL